MRCRLEVLESALLLLRHELMLEPPSHIFFLLDGEVLFERFLDPGRIHVHSKRGAIQRPFLSPPDLVNPVHLLQLVLRCKRTVQVS